MGRNEYGISGHLHIFAVLKHLMDAFELQFFSGLHFYTLSKTLIACKNRIRTTPPGTTPPQDDSPGGRLPRRTSPPEDDSPGGNNNNNNNNNNDNTGHLSCEGVVLRGSCPVGESSSGGDVLRGSHPPGEVVLQGSRPAGETSVRWESSCGGVVRWESSGPRTCRDM